MSSVTDQDPPIWESAPLLTLVDIPTSLRFVRHITPPGAPVRCGRDDPFVRVGHLIRFDLDELNEWIDVRRAGSITST